MFHFTVGISLLPLSNAFYIGMFFFTIGIPLLPFYFLPFGFPFHRWDFLVPFTFKYGILFFTVWISFWDSPFAVGMSLLHLSNAFCIGFCILPLGFSFYSLPLGFPFLLFGFFILLFTAWISILPLGFPFSFLPF